jgi:endonuclease YncB( thermonuclease family)
MRVALGLSVAALMSSLMAFDCDADSLSGRASVLDGDSIEIRGQRVRILDIDAPESGQLCFRRGEIIEQGAWRCGVQAAKALADWIGQQSVTCDTTTIGPRKGWLSRCTVAGQDIAVWLAANGWAVPSRTSTSDAVRAAAEQAKTAGIGVWSGAFTSPWEWRAAR